MENHEKKKSNKKTPRKHGESLKDKKFMQIIKDKVYKVRKRKIQ